MKFVNRIEIKFEGFDNCHVICDQDCPLGKLYDYACSFKSLIFQKIQESEGQIPVEKAPLEKAPEISPVVEKLE